MTTAFTLAPDEKIIVILRRHRLILAMSLIKVGLAALIPLVVALILAFWQPFLIAAQPGAAIFWYLASLFWLIVWCWGILVWLDWYLDIWALTNRRLIDIEQEKFFHRQVLECSLDKVQNVTCKINGPLATFFKYGNVEIKTADQATLLVFEQIPFPNQIQNAILQAHQEYLGNVGGKNET